MTYPELQIQFDLNPDNRVDVLKNTDTCGQLNISYLFVDSEDGQCYLFNEDGQKDDISKVKIIGHWMFEDCTSLKSIKIPSLVEWIGDGAFYNCRSLTNINISDSVMSIGYGAFAYCESLTSIKIPSSVEWIINWAFEECTSLKEVVFKGKTMNEVKAMNYYPWGIQDISIIKTKS